MHVSCTRWEQRPQELGLQLPHIRLQYPDTVVAVALRQRRLLQVDADDCAARGRWPNSLTSNLQE